MTDPAPSTAAKQASLFGCLLRFVWMAAGNVVLFFLGMTIAQRNTRALSWLDGALWGVAGIMIAVRYLDIARFGGKTSEGEPAGIKHLRRYVVILIVTTAGWWALAHALALTGWLR